MHTQTILTRGLALAAAAITLTGCSVQPEQPSSSAPVVISTLQPDEPAQPSPTSSAPAAPSSGADGETTAPSPDASPSQDQQIHGPDIPQDAMEDPDKMADWIRENPQVDPIERGALLDEFSEVGDFQAQTDAAIELALEAAETMSTFMPAEDYDPMSAQMRARDMMTAELYESLEVPERPETDPMWVTAVENGWSSQPEVRAVTQEGDKAPYVNVIASWDWVDENGQKKAEDKIRRFFYYTIAEVDGELKITDFTYSDLDPIANYNRP